MEEVDPIECQDPLDILEPEKGSQHSASSLAPDESEVRVRACVETVLRKESKSMSYVCFCVRVCKFL